MVMHVSAQDFEKEVLKSEKPVIVDFWASWCSPCLMLAPVFEQLSSELTSMKFVKLDTEVDPELAAKYNVMSIPTLIVFQRGKEVERLVGYMTKASLKEKLKGVV